MTRIASISAIVVAVALSPLASAFAPIAAECTSQSRPSTTLHYETPKQPSSTTTSISSRRSFLTKAGTLTASTISLSLTSSLLPIANAANAAEPSSTTKEALLTDLQTSLTKITPIPDLLQNSEWDKVRTILKTPPVNQLWNLGESQNTLVKLAKETGEFELVEMKDELAISLQMTDQYSYDNVFIYYQPGNGKVKVKEPLEMAKKAIVQLKEAIEVANSS